MPSACFLLHISTIIINRRPPHSTSDTEHRGKEITEVDLLFPIVSPIIIPDRFGVHCLSLRVLTWQASILENFDQI